MKPTLTGTVHSDVVFLHNNKRRLDESSEMPQPLNQKESLRITKGKPSWAGPFDAVNLGCIYVGAGLLKPIVVEPFHQALEPLVLFSKKS